MNPYEPVIGLEVHAQLATRSKMFCPCPASFGDPPNTNICPVCTAQPGTLPVVNAAAIDMAILAGLAIGSEIQGRSLFARKNYFYPDLPKGYQISQYELPLCRGGSVDIRSGGGTKTISITRIHLEEDAGKLLHDTGHPERSHIDFNRCGVPLIEIVSGPDMNSPTEASAYLKTLRGILVALGICEGNLEEGNFRCDANVSLKPAGSSLLGTRTEMKNLNSFKAVERALAHEIERHRGILEGGGSVAQETRLWNDAEGRTEPMRSKEESHDYRYFPDPDLLPLVVDPEWVASLRAKLPELPRARTVRFVTQHALPQSDADILTEDRFLADYFEAVVRAGAPAKKAANWIISELLRELGAAGAEIRRCPLSPDQLSALIGLVEKGAITGKIAKEVFTEMYATGRRAGEIVAEKGLKQVDDAGAIESAVDGIIAAFPQQVAQYRSGKAAVLGFLVGQVMKVTRGQANPQMVNEILKRKLADGA